MGRSPLSHLLRHLNGLLDGRPADGLSDAALLERFAAKRDEAAFEVLVWRHGPMVHGLCRRLLRRAEDADDAFQAVFLILVRKARSIARRDSLGGWLYKVAYRVALEARAREARHAASPPCDAESPAGDASDDAERRDLRQTVAEEVDRLPEKYRLPVVLCYLSGKTTEEAARSLGCPRGTVLSRLAAARRRLHGRLVRRGVALTVAALAAALEQKAAAAPAALVSLTVKAAAWLIAGKAGGAGVASAPVQSLVKGVLKAMLVKKLKWAAAVLVAAALVGGGVGLWFRQPAAAESPARAREAAPAPAAPADEPRAVARVEDTNRPLGSWEKDLGPYHLTLRVEADRLFVSYSGAAKDQKITLDMDADYSVTKDNLLYGVISGVDAEGTGDEPAKALLEATALLDYPFSCRYRVDGNVLTVKDVKFGSPPSDNNGHKEPEELMILVGRWKKRADTGRDAPR